jgi:hypothetical protein
MGEANGHGIAAKGGAGAPDFEPFLTADALFGSSAAAKPGHGDSFHFKDEIFSPGVSESVDHGDVGTLASISHRENVAHAVSEDTPANELSQAGQHSADHFSNVPKQAEGGAVGVHVPHDLIV